MHWAHWTVRVLQAHRQAHLKNYSIFRPHSKSSLLAPEFPPLCSDNPACTSHARDDTVWPYQHACLYDIQVSREGSVPAVYFPAGVFCWTNYWRTDIKFKPCTLLVPKPNWVTSTFESQFCLDKRADLMAKQSGAGQRFCSCDNSHITKMPVRNPRLLGGNVCHLLPSVDWVIEVH